MKMSDGCYAVLSEAEFISLTSIPTLHSCSAVVKGQFHFTPFHYDSYRSIISVLEVGMLVQHKQNEIPALPEELPLRTVMGNCVSS